MTRTFVLCFFIVVSSAWVASAEMPCTIHPPKNAPDSELTRLAKVSAADAEKAALSGFSNFASQATIASAELEVERGCLLYSLDVRVAGQKGVEEVLVDAGTGKVLSRRHETSRHEAVESKREAERAKHEADNAADVEADEKAPAAAH